MSDLADLKNFANDIWAESFRQIDFAYPCIESAIVDANCSEASHGDHNEKYECICHSVTYFKSSTCCIMEIPEDVKDIVHKLEDNCRNSRIPNFTPTWTSPSCSATATSTSSPSARILSSSDSYPYFTSSSRSKSDGDDKPSTGIIIGIAVGAIIFIFMMWAAFKLWQTDKARKEILNHSGRAHLSATTSIPTRNATRSYPAGTPVRPSRARTRSPRASTPPPPPPYVEREADPKLEPAPPRYEV